MSKYDEMVKLTDEATEALERLRGELEERAEATSIIEMDPSDADNPTVEPLEYVAGEAVLALSNVFEVVKALAADGVIELPDAPLPLADASLVTILANAELAQRHMRADLEWATKVIERVR